MNKHPVVQSEDYYPFGLTFNSFQRVTAKENRWKFQGQERVDDLGLDWDMFLFRTHDPSIGRFLQTDPLAEDYYYNSPYAFAENKVISYFELEGLEAGWAGSGHGFNLTNSQEFKKLPREEKIRQVKAAGKALKSASREAADEIPFVGEILSLLEGDYVGVIAGIVPFGKKGKKVGEEIVDAIDDAKDTAKKAKKKPGSSTKENTRGQGKDNTLLESSQEQLEGIEEAQDKAKKQKKGQKQNKIKSTKKSQQRLDNDLKRIDNLDDLKNN